MPFIITIAAIMVAIGLFLIIRGALNMDPRQLAQVLKWVGLGLLAVIVMVLAATGKLGPALALAAAVLPFVMNWRALKNRMKAARGPSPGGASELRTNSLSMRLDHATGALDGWVERGRFRGRQLSSLKIGEAIDLLNEMSRDDPDSVPLVETFLDRAEPGWRDLAGGRPETPSGGGPINRRQAFEILGLAEGADEAAIREAHRVLMKKLHPDQGGSTWLAARINQAKDMLLGN